MSAQQDKDGLKSQSCADGSLPVLTAPAAPSAAHTPGPWSACGQDRGGCSCGWVWSKAVDQPVAKANTIWGDDLDHPYGEIPFAEMVANARLIAAAPDLLTEAREICAILDCYRADTGEEPCFDHEAIGEEVARRHDSLTAAIAKATTPTSGEAQ